MNENVHYEDNLFYLAGLIRILSDGTKLNIDPDYFGEKVQEDILFIDTSLQKLYVSLKQNPHLLRRLDHLHSLMKIMKSYVRMIEQALAGQSPISGSLVPLSHKLKRTVAARTRDAGDIREILMNQGEVPVEKDLISYEELGFLMTPVDDNDDGDGDDG